MRGRKKTPQIKEKEKKRGMVNITINIPDIYDKNIQKLIEMKIVPNRSEAIRIALREYLQQEGDNLELLEFNNHNLVGRPTT